MIKFPATAIKGLPQPVSDHCPILLETELPKEGPHPFQFENMWIRHRKFKENVQIQRSGPHIHGWANYIFLQRLKNLKLKLKSWNKETFGQIDQQREEILKGICSWMSKKLEREFSEEEMNARNFLKHGL